MSTALVAVVPTVEQFMETHAPTYIPFFTALLGNSQSYPEQVGSIDYRSLTTVGDIRQKHIIPKDNLIHQIAVGEAKKSFKRYFFGNQFVISDYQSRQGIEDVLVEVQDEHNKQFDELALYGEGTAPGNQVNNGLYFSSDVNYVLKSSAAIAASPDYQTNLYAKILALAEEANLVSGRKLIVFYGTLITPVFNGLFSGSPVAFKSVIADGLGSDYSFAQLPVNPADGTSGFMIINLDKVKFHYTTLPRLKKTGTNEEKEYAFFNFNMGSCMVEVKAVGALIRQPLTLA